MLGLLLKGNPDWIVRLNAYIVHVVQAQNMHRLDRVGDILDIYSTRIVQARNMHHLDRVGDILDIYSTRCTGTEHVSFR